MAKSQEYIPPGLRGFITEAVLFGLEPIEEIYA
jgi:hypothetical protein